MKQEIFALGVFFRRRKFSKIGDHVQKHLHEFGRLIVGATKAMRAEMGLAK